MSILVPITLYGWIVVAIGLFAVLPPRRAVLAAYVLAWLFLPQAGIPFQGFPDLDKITATSLGAMIGVVIFDAGRLRRYRPSWVDLPMAVWCLCNIPSSLTNAPPLDLYDGISGVVRDLFVWGIPYFVGRLYFSDLESLRELAIGIFVGGLIYVPLCVYELRMSPCLHEKLYGFHPTPFLMTLRYGGYRPMVFMQHGLMVGLWMTAASVVGVWLWHTGSLRTILRAPTWIAVGVLLVTTILCKSTGAIALLVVALMLLYANKYVRSSAILIIAVSITPLYMAVRTEGIWDGKELVELAAMINEERASSLEGRLENEDLINSKALQKPTFGWGGWGRWRVVDPKTGQDITISDGMWVIVRGEKGLVGLVSVTAVILLPFLLFLRRVPARSWAHAAFAAPAALAMLLMLYSIDNLFNAMLNPIFLLGAGGLSGFYLAFPRLQAMARQAQWVAYQQWQVRSQAMGANPPASSPTLGAQR